MILGGIWYYNKVTSQQGQNFLYRLLTNVGPTFFYSHLVVASKFPMFTTIRKKSDLKLMAIKDKAKLLVNVKER
jgi:hypothetical protein